LIPYMSAATSRNLPPPSTLHWSYRRCCICTGALQLCMLSVFGLMLAPELSYRHLIMWPACPRRFCR
jgi:hypothetical protein